MTANIENLVPDIQKLFEGKDLSEKIHHLTSKLGQSFVDRFVEYAEERKPTLRMSNLGRPLRQLYYELKGYKGEKLSPEAKLKFLYGNLIEELLLHLAVEAGHEVTHLQQEIEVDGVKGHIDAIIDSVLIDVKSCSTRSFEKFEKGTLLQDDPFGYIAQLTGYAKALGTPRAAFLAVDKTLGKICLFEINVGEYDVPARIQKVRRSLDSDLPPNRCYDAVPDGKSGNEKLATACSYCAYKFECWKDANNGEGLKTYLYSSSPRFLTKVVREPRVNVYEQFPTRED